MLAKVSSLTASLLTFTSRKHRATTDTSAEPLQSAFSKRTNVVTKVKDILYRMSLTLVTTLVLFEKALCNGSADVSVVARCFLEVKVSREAVKELTFANIW